MTHSNDNRRPRSAALVPLILLGAFACGPQDAPQQGHVGEPLPDTFPVTGTGSDLPQGMPLPPQPDTIPGAPPPGAVAPR